MKRFALLFLVLLMVACGEETDTDPGTGIADETALEAGETVDNVYVEGELTVENVQAEFDVADSDASIWMAISNGTETDDRLVRAESEECDAIELRDTTVDGEPRVVDEIPSPAGQLVILQEGGLHLACIGNPQLSDGDSFNVDLFFQSGMELNEPGRVRGE